MTEILKAEVISPNWTSPLAEEKKLITIQGILNKRIELKKGIYCLSFVKLKGQTTDLPVIFKIKDENNKLIKPEIAPGCLIELTGHYSNPETSIRKSFTCSSYQILSPPPTTIPQLKEQIQSLLTTSQAKYQEWTQRKDFLSQKLAEVKELNNLTQLDPQYLTAYLLVKDAYYTNYQANFPLPNFNLEKYLATIGQEIALVSQNIQAYQRKSYD